MTRQRDRASVSSIRARLLDRAKRQGEDYQRVLVQYANERVLYRLSRSSHREAFILKGASLLFLWDGQMPRATKDVDLLGTGSPDPTRLRQVFAEILATEVEGDGVTFDLDGIAAAPIREEAVYDGVRVTFEARLGTAKLALQVDVGFGDAVEPLPELVDYPTLLDSPAPRLSVYRREVVVAEKFHAMVTLGLANSRMKDYFDVAFLARRFTFEGVDLTRALGSTFERRQTPLPAEQPAGLSDQFALDAQKQAQWSSFTRRVLGEPGTLAETVELVRAFVWPAVQTAASGQQFALRWQDGRWGPRPH